VNLTTCDVLGYAAAGHAQAVISEQTSRTILEREYMPPTRRLGGSSGMLGYNVLFAAYEYFWQGKEFLIYVIDGRDGASPYPVTKMAYILSRRGGKGKEVAEEESDPDADELIQAVTKWGVETHEEILVFDRGMWIKDKDLWNSVNGASWDNVILEGGKKQALIDDVENFYNGQASYEEFSVPWKVRITFQAPIAISIRCPLLPFNPTQVMSYLKSNTNITQRGLIFHGPPGNGKTISIKALMNSLTKRTNPTVELLYVKSFNSFMGPEYGILTKARQMAPCILVFEDLDSLVSPLVRSYFLNAVDGLESNHGILMIGSTNHLERLDPGIAKRPSRFDRNFFFGLPSRDERALYCEYWRHKLRHNTKIDFPQPLCGMIADITDDFSFAYLKEAFVAALLAIVVARPEEQGLLVVSKGTRVYDSDRERAEKSLLWREIQKQIKILRDELTIPTWH
jgi:transitional endoplasmic reticulum ATPase